jgi:hypothetical protein
MHQHSLFVDKAIESGWFHRLKTADRHFVVRTSKNNYISMCRSVVVSNPIFEPALRGGARNVCPDCLERLNHSRELVRRKFRNLTPDPFFEHVSGIKFTDRPVYAEREW